MANSVEKGARISAQMGATRVTNNSVSYDAVNINLLPTLKGGASDNIYCSFSLLVCKLDFSLKLLAMISSMCT